MEYHGQFVHKGDIDIPLRILDHLGRFGYLDALCPVYSRFDYKLVYFGDNVQRFFIYTGYNLHDVFQPVNLISRVNPLGRIADFEIFPAPESRLRFENRYTDILCHSRIHR
ncbi:hypothetical protein D3C77_403920 [compost metagenome]